MRHLVPSVLEQRVQSLEQRIALNPPVSGRFALRNVTFASIVIATIMASLTLVSGAVGVAYHQAFYGSVGPVEIYFLVGPIAGFLYALPFLLRERYSIETYLQSDRRATNMFAAWVGALLLLGVVAFLTKTTATVSRGWIVLFFAFGFLTLVAVEKATRAGVALGVRAGWIPARRLMLIGTEDEIRSFSQRFAGTISRREKMALRVVATTVVQQAAGESGPQRAKALAANLKDGAENARRLAVDDVIILGAWSQTDLVDAAFEALTLLPVAIHLDTGAVFPRHTNMKVARVGTAPMLSLTQPPLSALELILKRAFDIVVGSVALIVLSPVFLGVSLCIWLESGRPVFFTQNRLGYNQRRFRIIKFRSMNAMDDGPNVRQASGNDARITRVGRFIRRWNLDELPQLINVLKGDMSIVGPRPHAVAHDIMFEQRIMRYPRRLNVKPGMTGWAQVNGLRGETDTDEKMRQRVEFDLHYIDNWSIMLDVYIMWLTVTSPKAYRNAV